MNGGDSFDALADAYAACRPVYPETLAAFLAGIAPATGTAWEAGCGSGQLSQRLAAHFDRVVACDTSARQLAAAAPHPRIEYRREAAERCSLSDGGADIAVAAQAAHWFDLDTYYREVRRVVRPGGVVALITYGEVSIDAATDAVIHDFYGNTLTGRWAPERRHVENGYRSLDFPFEEITIPVIEMQHDWTLTQLLGYIATWSALRTFGDDERRVAITTLGLELRESWGAVSRVRRVRWPVAGRVGRVGRLSGAT